MILRVNRDNYFYDSKTRKRLEEYDPKNKNLEFAFRMNGYRIHVAQDQIKASNLGICFRYNGITYMIDDDHQQKLTFAAYLINNNYFNRIEKNSKKGIKTRDQISSAIYRVLTTEFPLSHCKIKKIRKINLNYYVDFKLPKSEGTLVFQTVSNLVNTNKTRREFDLPYYPYIRGVDRYNAYYMTMWCDKDCERSIGFLFLSELVEKLNRESAFSFSAQSLPINTRIIRVHDKMVKS